MAEGWHTAYSNTGPGVTGTQSNGNITSADQAYQNASDVASNYYEKQLENEAVTRSWTSTENELNRQFQLEMSNTAHQREVKDLIAAGLNPVLSAKLGGASTTSGSSQGVPSTSAASSAGNIFSQVFSSAMGLVNTILTNEQRERESIRTSNTNVLTTGMNNSTAIETNRLTNLTNITINDAKNMTEKEIANLDNSTKMYLAEEQRQLDQKLADENNDVKKYCANLDYEANVFDTNEASRNKELDRAFEKWQDENVPSNLWNGVAQKVKALEKTIWTETGAKSVPEAFSIMLPKVIKFIFDPDQKETG